jgi:general secretion pathway protein I
MSSEFARRAPGRRNRGFTLIEVLVAMSIVVVSFVAIYGVVLQMVGATTLMQEKTMASWVAFDRVTELRVSGDYPGEGSEDGLIEMGGSTWSYTREVRNTASEDLRQIIVKVSLEDEPDNILAMASGALVRNQRTAGNIPTDQLNPGFGGTNPADENEGTDE